MADQQTELAIVIEAINNASKELKQVEKDLGDLSKAATEQGVVAKTASLGFGKLVAGMVTGNIIATLATGAFRKLTSILTDLPRIFFDIVRSAGEINQTGIGMLIVANNAGIMGKEVLKVRDEIVGMNVTTQAANTLLRDLIRSEVDYAKATELVAATQNIASATGHSTSEAIERVSHAISSGIPWVLRDLGIKQDLNSVYKEYAVSIDRSTESLTQAEKRTAIMNLVLKEGEKYVGAYEAAMKSSAKIMGQTRDRITEISYNLGSIFEPALAEGAKAVKEFVEKIVEWAHENREKLMGLAQRVSEFVKTMVEAIRSFIKNIPWDRVINAINSIIRGLALWIAAQRQAFNVIQIFTRGLRVSIDAIVSFGKAMWALTTGDFKAIGQIYTDWTERSAKAGEAIIGDFKDIASAGKFYLDKQKFNIEEWWDDIKAVEGGGWKDISQIRKEEWEKMTAEQQKALSKMYTDLGKANLDYQRAVEDRVKQFNESFEDLVLRHRDNIKELTEDLASENKDYNDKLQDLVADYDEAMETIEARHTKKTESILEDIEDERKRAEEEIEKITEKYNEQKVLLEREGEARVGDLKSQLDKERALGDNADKEKIAALEQMIAYEDEGLGIALDAMKAKNDEEISDIEEKLSEKLAKIQKELNEENELYAESFSKRKTQYEKDVADAKESYEEKRQSLQEELDKETEIRNRYADDFTRLADMVAEDDITRLVRKHGEELSEMERDHNEKLSEIKKNAFEQGEGFMDQLSDGLSSGYPQVKSELDKVKRDFDDVSGSIQSFYDHQRKYSYIPGGSWDKSSDIFSGGGSWAKGGLVTSPGIVGEAGPEIVLPLDSPKRMAMIMKSMGLAGGQGGQVTQNFYVSVSGQQDVDVLMERAGFAMKNQGGFN